ncbi:hypothetical protein GDO81_011032 [Engystomops pustulosus]|uniref:MADF domain-containing protein n=1 Tax=Engystomops pustulosus TaxID=76066 RepID=A0AAV7C430_ENGPU|nr:hypothetical protein GDO81_011032 [Engystomops pustulosus]
MSFDVEKLIILVQEQPELWDKRSESYCDRKKRGSAWEAVAQRLVPDQWSTSTSAEKSKLLVGIQTRWRSCRDQFRREFLPKRDNANTSKKRPYLYLNQLMFLKDIMEPGTTCDSLGEAVEMQQSAEVEEAGPDIPPSSRAAPLQSSSSRGRKRKLLASEENLEDMAHQKFLESLIPHLWKVPDQLQISTQTALMNVLAIPPNNPSELFRAIDHFRLHGKVVAPSPTQPSAVKRPPRSPISPLTVLKTEDYGPGPCKVAPLALNVYSGHPNGPNGDHQTQEHGQHISQQQLQRIRDHLRLRQQQHLLKARTLSLPQERRPQMTPANPMPSMVSSPGFFGMGNA